MIGRQTMKKIINFLEKKNMLNYMAKFSLRIWIFGVIWCIRYQWKWEIIWLWSIQQHQNVAIDLQLGIESLLMKL